MQHSVNLVPLVQRHHRENSFLLISLLVHGFMFLLVTLWMRQVVTEMDTEFGFMQAVFVRLKQTEISPRPRPNMQPSRITPFVEKETSAPVKGGSQTSQYQGVVENALVGAEPDWEVSIRETDIPPIETDAFSLTAVSTSWVVGTGGVPRNNPALSEYSAQGQMLYQMDRFAGARQVRSARRFEGSPAGRGAHDTLRKWETLRPELPFEDSQLGLREILGNTPRPQRVVYCVDVSASLYEPISKIATAIQETQASFHALHAASYFTVLTFARQVVPMPEGLMPVTSENVRIASRFLDQRLDTPLDYLGTDILGVLREAFRHHPTDIVLITDGWAADNPNAPGSIVTASDTIQIKTHAMNMSNTSLHVIGMTVDPDSTAGTFLRALAENNRGQYRFPQLRSLYLQ